MADDINSIKQASPILGEAIKLAPVQVNDGSQILGVSLRGLIVITFVITICVMAVMKVAVTEPLNTLAIAAVSYYFGHQNGSSTKKTV